MLKLKSVYDPRQSSDGLRILVSSYYPKQATLGFFDLWFPQLGNPLELVKNWQGENYTWQKFKNLYLHHLQEPEIQSLLHLLAETARTKDITLIGHSREEHLCQRSLLKERLL